MTEQDAKELALTIHQIALGFGGGIFLFGGLIAFGFLIERVGLWVIKVYKSAYK